ncbi:Rpn family recombination-promoting nuclease/putative transposase [Parabacteroides sp. PF5-6]|uniref:Rpn family recombination-promoting nuclease/putative transposase n=1 Tax=Parabacteroides sp. PF5-6 TaxID=1742403 RepID=UPI002406EBA9|nr:Rpn family recombination-promoting nuclease/putative transposase [Parabacteroides sp. PF5-6]
MEKYLNPFTDMGFKRLFGQEANKDLLIGFLNGLFTGERQIEDLTFMDKEIIPESQGGRVVIFDILCRESDGTQFIVEMQNQRQEYFFDRGLYYLCRMISEQGRRGGKWKYEICPVYGIYFLNFKIPELTKLRTDIILADRDTGEQVNGKLRQIYLSLPYFNLRAEECKTDLERWIYILKNMDTTGITPYDTQQRKIFKKLLDVADIDKLSRKERLQYEANLKAFRDYNSTMDYAIKVSREKGLRKGIKEGIKEGMTKGREVGIKEGMHKGREVGIKEGMTKGREVGIKEGMHKGREVGIKEGMHKGREVGIKEGMHKGREVGLAEGREEERRQFGIKLKTEGFSYDFISRLTGLSIEEIERLQSPSR